MNVVPYYLTEEDIIAVLTVVSGHEVEVRDYGLLSAAAARPAASAFGDDAYPTMWQKAAALLHSLTRNHPFVDGNKRAGWNAAWTFIEINKAAQLAEDFDVDAAERMVLDVAEGKLDEIATIAKSLESFAE